jgi:hypothetical protein
MPLAGMQPGYLEAMSYMLVCRQVTRILSYPCKELRSHSIRPVAQRPGSGHTRRLAHPATPTPRAGPGTPQVPHSPSNH